MCQNVTEQCHFITTQYAFLFVLYLFFIIKLTIAHFRMCLSSLRNPGYLSPLSQKRNKRKLFLPLVVAMDSGLQGMCKLFLQKILQ